MTADCIDTFLMNLRGTSQAQRSATFLDPKKVNLNDLELTDYMQLAHNFAKEIHFFNTHTPENPTGDWQKFFLAGDAETLQSFLDQAEINKDVTPHLTLFICFLKLLEHSKLRFNAITQRHLDFYYAEVLQIQKKPAQKDQVHLLFELAKNIDQYALPEQTQLLAGKDENNTPRIYETQQTTVLNRATLTSIKSIYKDPTEKVIKASQKTNSFDGVEEDLKENPFWLPFGYPNTFKDRPALPDATLGFAVSASVLKMSSGTRQVCIHTSFDEDQTIAQEALIELINVYITGEKGWLGPFKLQTESLYPEFITSTGVGFIDFAFRIEATEKSIIAYNPEIHSGAYSNENPVVKFELPITSPEAYDLAQQLGDCSLNEVEVAVAVDGLTDLELSNDVGNLSASKPFYPFGPRPFQKSSFKIKCPELYEKNWHEINLRLNWLNLPDDFAAHYMGYRSGTINSSRAYVKSIYNIDSQTDLKELTELSESFTNNPKNLIVESSAHFNAQITIGDENKSFSTIHSKNEHPLFEEASSETDINIKSLSATGIKAEEEAIKISLNTSFYHAQYSKHYALALAAQNAEVIIPNEPYTPLLESLALSYHASQKLDFKSKTIDKKPADQLKLLQIHPYGSIEDSSLFPKYDQGGFLHLGLTNAKPGNQINLLFEIQEGTENPLKESFAENEKIKWSVLTDEGWNPLSAQEIIRDETDNFLKTGIVTIAIPESGTLESSLLPSGQIWLQAHTPRDFDAVCRFLNIHTQVAKAQLATTSTDHLKNGLPAETISKLNTRLAQIKSVKQPYASFNGQTQESQEAYYKRISERLRHKDRALTLWDYEHLVLQHFPDIYKVKCINHTCKTKFKSAGNVTLVVIPNTINKPTYDLFEPRCSTALLNEIQDFLNARSSFFVKPQVINPVYEPITVSLKVKFHKGYDDYYYKNELQEAIKKWLSPWAFEDVSSLIFGVSVIKSMLISHLEQLPYVDYLTDVVSMHQEKAKNEIIPSTPKAILVSAKMHNIALAATSCAIIENQTEISC